MARRPRLVVPLLAATAWSTVPVPAPEPIVTIDQAQSAALARVPGTLTDTRLDSDRGRVVYDIEIANAYGVIENVKLDAGNGRVLTVKTVSNPIPIGDEMEAP